jgi:diguanylate cyclase (GGDEF)-like protein
MNRSLSPLRSWLKEERRLLPRGARPWRLAASALALVGLLFALEILRREARISADLETQRSDRLELLNAALSDIRRTVFDWARWEDSLLFAQGRNPQFVERDMAQSSLFSGGGVMVVFDRQGQPLVRYSRKGINHPADETLQNCTKANLSSLTSLTSAVQLFCPGQEQGPFLGVLAQISNNDSTAPAAGAMVMLEPLIGPDQGPRLRGQLEALAAKIVSGGSRQAASLPSPIRLYGPDGRPIGLTPISSLGPLLTSLRDDLLLLIMLLVPLQLIRMQLTLAHRRQRLGALHRERLASERIRRVCKQLDGLLGRPGSPEQQLSAQQRVMERLLHEKTPAVESAGHPLALERRLDAFATRFQHFLDGANNLALLDQLTQLPNRRFFIEQLAHEVERHQQQQQPIALLFVDIDRFKEINDSFGHSTGDRALVHVAEWLRQLIGPRDFLARYGGDEFVILHQLETAAPSDLESQRHNTLRFAETIAAAYEGPVDLDGVAIELSLSLGITLLRPDLPRPESAMQQCDLAMLRAKQNKHNRIAIFDLDHADPRDSDYELYTDLLQAIRDHELTVLFQPIVDAEGLPRAVEALARWQHPRRGWVPPEQFLNLAERHRQILRLSDALLQQALSGFQHIGVVSGRPLHLSFNISPTQLEDPSLVSRIMHQLELHSMVANQLTLELTERGILEGSAIVRDNLRQLREQGICLSLDDFGTGYSSLSLLGQLQPDEVKIDRSFVMGMETDPYALQIITLLARMAPELGFQLVAEGVEDASTFARLRQLGITRFQGYWFARPMACAAVDADAALPAAA